MWQIAYSLLVKKGVKFKMYSASENSEIEFSNIYKKNGPEIQIQ